MPLYILCETNDFDLTEQTECKWQRLAGELLRQERPQGDPEVVVTIVDDRTIRELNQQFRGIDQATDVLSFSQQESGADEPTISAPPDCELLGDVIISWQTAFRQSQELGHSLERELAFLMVHGLLHLLGYDHEDEAQELIMQAKQRTAMDTWRED